VHQLPASGGVTKEVCSGAQKLRAVHWTIPVQIHSEHRCCRSGLTDLQGS
jgi:hypothetical protein